MKPTDVDTLWVHVTCAWFRPEVGFPNYEKMEPAVGFFKIPSDSFVKVQGLSLNTKMLFHNHTNLRSLIFSF